MNEKKLAHFYNYKLEIGFKNHEFMTFLKKFIGIMIFNGKKDKALKNFYSILYILKDDFKVDPFVVFKNAINNLVPIMSYGQKRFGKKYVILPKMSHSSERYIYILNWIFRNLKNKSNIFGVKMSDIANVISDAFYNKGRAIQSKRAFYKLVMSSKHLLRVRPMRYYKMFRRRYAKKFLLYKNLKFKKRKFIIIDNWNNYIKGKYKNFFFKNLKKNLKSVRLKRKFMRLSDHKKHQIWKRVRPIIKNDRRKGYIKAF